MPHYKLTYFNIRGRAEVIRFLFALSGEEYEDVRYERSEWPAYKANTLFGQIPQLEEDGKVLCQCHVIEAYLAKKFGYAGKTDFEHARCAMIVNCLEDFIKPLLAIQNETSDKAKEEKTTKFYNEELPSFMEKFDKLLQSNGHFVGEELTYADITFYHYTQLPYVFTGTHVDWDRWPRLKAAWEMVENTEKIKEWISKRPVTEQ